MKFNTRLASLLMLCAAIPTTTFAASVHYDMTFTSSGVTPTGSFDYDADAPSFSNFLVQLVSSTFDFTSFANSKTHYLACQGPTGAAAAFSMVDGSCGARTWFTMSTVMQLTAGTTNLDAFSDMQDSLSGTFTITSATSDAPEPASLGLILLGGLGIFTARRKFARN